MGLLRPALALAILGSSVWASWGTTISPILPPDGETNVSSAPSLGVWVSGTQQTNLNVAFYARAMIPRPDFTIVILPDTQSYTSSLRGGSPALFAAQTDWVVANRQARNIAFVAHTGDCVNSGDAVEAEWWAATNAMYRLENPFTTLLEGGIPYSVAMGNHDGN